MGFWKVEGWLVGGWWLVVDGMACVDVTVAVAPIVGMVVIEDVV